MDSSRAVAVTMGLLIGYLTGEAATVGPFERLLWPQRFFHSARFSSLWRAALIMPTGGFFYKVTLQTLDKLQKNGLLFQPNRGHMLGSLFYPDSGHKFERGDTLGDNKCRNGFWISVLEYCSRKYHPPGGGPGGKKPPRSIQTVCLLNLDYRLFNQKMQETVVSLSDETGPVNRQVVAGLLASEAVAIAVGIALYRIWPSWFVVLWFAPLAIKLLSAFFTVHREPLDLHLTPKDVAQVSTHHLYHPTDGFMVIRGPTKVVQQFSRHYGHPIRNRSRECIQIILILALNLLFPVGMACLLWMPTEWQNAWLGYQLYVALAMHGYRYWGGNICCSIQEAVGDALLIQGGADVCLMQTEDSALVASLTITAVNSVDEGRQVMAKLLSTGKTR